MKYLIFCLFFFCTGFVGLLAQQSYIVKGFAGKDTLDLGTVIPDSKGKTQLELRDYNGLVILIPQSDAYQDIASHLAKIPSINSEATFNAAKAYVNDTLSFDVLYNSGMWREYIQNWVAFYAQTTQSADEFATVFVPVAKRVLDRIVPVHPKIASYLTHDLIEFFEQFGLDKAAEKIAAYSFGLNLEDAGHGEISARLLTASKIMNNPAPEIPGVSDLKQIIVLFYETGCGNCNLQLDELKRHYNELQSRGYQIVTVSADNDERVYKYTADSFPWAMKVCDLKGFESEIFKKYGIASTPTIYVTDAEGKVTGRFARLSDTKIIDN